MTATLAPIQKDATDIFNYCTKYLVRERSNESADYTEGWRFPLVMTCLSDEKVCHKMNEVTFIYKKAKDENISDIKISGSFLPMYQTLPLLPVQFEGQSTALYYMTLRLPVANGYYYKYIVNGQPKLDPINPQKKKFANGKEWSFFFTDYYNYSNDFEEWEMNLMTRLTEQIVPFRTLDAQNFIERFYQNLPKGDKEAMPIYRLDESVGELNYITNLLAKEERHHLQDYKICLSNIDEVLRKRYVTVNSWEVPAEAVNQLYDELASGNVPGWNYQKYNNPTYFLKLFRRHCITGAFCHPRHGGNVGAAGWNYLKERYTIKDASGQVTGTYFNWDKAMEKPFGANTSYMG